MFWEKGMPFNIWPHLSSISSLTYLAAVDPLGTHYPGFTWASSSGPNTLHTYTHHLCTTVLVRSSLRTAGPQFHVAEPTYNTTGKLERSFVPETSRIQSSIFSPAGWERWNLLLVSRQPNYYNFKWPWDSLCAVILHLVIVWIMHFAEVHLKGLLETFWEKADKSSLMKRERK